MIMAGGTGGHIFPGLAVAECLRGQGWNVVWLGSRRGMETQLVAPRGYTMAWIRFSGVRGKGWLRAVTLPLELLVAFWESARCRSGGRPPRAGTARAPTRRPPPRARRSLKHRRGR